MTRTIPPYIIDNKVRGIIAVTNYALERLEERHRVLREKGKLRTPKENQEMRDIVKAHHELSRSVRKLTPTIQDVAVNFSETVFKNWKP